MGRRQNDVFVLGDEMLITEPNVGRDTGNGDTGDARDQTTRLPRFGTSGVGTSSASSSPLPRRLAALGLLAGASAVVAGLTLFAKPDENLTPPTPTSSAVTPSVSAPKVSVAPPPAQPVRHRHTVRRPSPHPRPASRKQHRRPRSVQEREPPSEEAPVSTPVDVTTPTPTPTPVSVPVTAPPPPPPSTPPPENGGGASAERPEFSFEK